MNLFSSFGASCIMVRPLERSSYILLHVIRHAEHRSICGSKTEMHDVLGNLPNAKHKAQLLGEPLLLWHREPKAIQVITGQVVVSTWLKLVLGHDAPWPIRRRAESVSQPSNRAEIRRAG